MLARRIALVSKNRQRLDFLELSCRMHGFSVERFGKVPPMDACYFLIFWDQDSIALPSFVPSNLVTISSFAKDEGKELLWPISLARLEKMLLSSKQETAEPDVATTDPSVVRYYKEHRQVLLGDRLFSLSEHEMRLLKRLCQAKGDAITREELNRLLGAERGNIADVYVCHLRRKFEKISNNGYIQTVRGVGYRTNLIWIEE